MDGCFGGQPHGDGEMVTGDSEDVSPLRRALNSALSNIIHLEHGIVQEVVPIRDPEQFRELQKAKTNILKAIDLEVETRERYRRRYACRRSKRDR
jgi:hypothetical protein